MSILAAEPFDTTPAFASTGFADEPAARDPEDFFVESTSEAMLMDENIRQLIDRIERVVPRNAYIRINPDRSWIRDPDGSRRHSNEWVCIIATDGNNIKGSPSFCAWGCDTAEEAAESALSKYLAWKAKLAEALGVTPGEPDADAQLAKLQAAFRVTAESGSGGKAVGL